MKNDQTGKKAREAGGEDLPALARSAAFQKHPCAKMLCANAVEKLKNKADYAIL
ncbi:MAG: hypothetical protein HDT26_10315 [Subdoligranulum sp.]|nr:hypothetical protein [Subdoligranulum sp.]